MLPPFVLQDIQRLETLIAEARGLGTTTTHYTLKEMGYDGNGFLGWQQTPQTSTFAVESYELNVRLEQAVNQIAPDSTYSKEIATCVTSANHAEVASALCKDLKAGFYNSSRDLAHADVFGDLLGMAEHQLDLGYKIASAVIAGSALESHLRQLAMKHGVSTTNSAGDPLNGGPLNIELAKAKIYDAILKNSIEVWQRIRNSAAHGSKTNAELDKADIKAMIQGIQRLMQNHPA